MPKGFKATRKAITMPQKSAFLAEFFGIMLGDGGVSKYQIVITLNRFSDAGYTKYVINLIKKLFNISPSVYTYPSDSNEKSIVRIAISRRDLVEYLFNLGLVIGSKNRQQASVPKWILTHEDYKLSCVRGLIDTDGCIYTNTYIVNNKKYVYKKIAFSNRSIPLLNFMYETCKNIGLNPYINHGINVRITSQDGVKKYMSIIGTNNPKHLIRYK